MYYAKILKLNLDLFQTTPKRTYIFINIYYEDEIVFPQFLEIENIKVGILEHYKFI